MSTNMDLKEWLALLKKARDDKNKVWFGASESRKDGQAAGY